MSGTVLYWNRRPGQFVNKLTGKRVQLAAGLSIGPMFMGSTREWYETFVETLIDMRNHLQRAAGKNPREVNIYVSPDALCILESTVLFKPEKTGGTIAGMNVIRSTSVPRFEAEVEFKSGASTERGRVIITED